MTDLQIKLATAAGQLGLALMVFYVAWRQWRTARNKLKLDLFDRRFAAYEELRDAANAFRRRHEMKQADAMLALAPTFRYLFGRKVSEAVVKMATRAMHIARLSEKTPIPDFASSSVDEAALKAWKKGQLELYQLTKGFDDLHRAVIEGTSEHLTLEH
ncbi:hypothetical protein [Stenotrophomonas maltophilia]|nr:hypothetical protein [Stenotrophomonas maltophilia]NRP02031.1 hypothetical protein [Stenotrophomonas maltophilia]